VSFGGDGGLKPPGRREDLFGPYDGNAGVLAEELHPDDLIRVVQVDLFVDEGGELLYDVDGMEGGVSIQSLCKNFCAHDIISLTLDSRSLNDSFTIGLSILSVITGFANGWPRSEILFMTSGESLSRFKTWVTLARDTPSLLESFALDRFPSVKAACHSYARRAGLE
jgi:hypothetical protein